MKTINAYQKLKSFAGKLDIISTNLRTTTGIEQLKSAKDFFVSIQALKIPIALTSLAADFKKKSKEEKYRGTDSMFNTWSELLSSTIEHATFLEESADIYKNAIDMQISGIEFSEEAQEALNKGSEAMLKGILISIKDFACLAVAVDITEKFVIPSMTKEELKPEIEDVTLN